MRSLADSLRDLIAHEGPISVERYMDICLKHYYATRDPLGADGDFTTAPEISQIFGELLGLWMIEVWHAMGSPSPFNLVELGPGRGTLMTDMLRAARIMPEFVAAARVHLVETSPALREKQKATLSASDVAISWHDSIEAIPEGPLLVIANEFFDALPVRQFVSTERGWCERLVGLDGGELSFGLKPEPERLPRKAPRLGEVREVHVVSAVLSGELAARTVSEGGAALIVDYGYWGPAFGDTLQALRKHAYVDPLLQPGDADLTTHVDFAQLAHAALAAGAKIHGIDTQASFLLALGIATRAGRLKQRTSPVQAVVIDEAVDRLIAGGPRGMGELFKVMALTHPNLESVPGLRTGLDAPKR